jgi:NAD(P)-dependent dehydrogenase (short-subunit alcohol dehydrogenase family)
VTRLEGAAVVTGAAGGIGFALAARCAADGMPVVLADVDPAALDEAARRLTDTGATVLALPTDVTDPASVEALAERSWERFGAVALVCNNAGVGPGGVAWEIPESVWRWVIDVDLWGVVYGLQAFVPRLVEQGHGHVLNTSSVAGLVGTPGMAPYSAAKHAVIGLSQSLRRDLELAGSPVGVTVLCPGMTRTRMNESGRAWPSDRLGPPPEGGLEPSHPATRAEFYARMNTEGQDADIVAAAALAAVREGRFWAVPDAGVLARVEAETGAVRAAAARDDARLQKENVR